MIYAQFIQSSCADFILSLVAIWSTNLEVTKIKSENNKHQCLLKFISHIITTSILEAASLTQRISHVFNAYNDINLSMKRSLLFPPQRKLDSSGAMLKTH